MKTYKFCQSCGMPMMSDPGLGGSEADGSKNLKYCSLCYVNGEFTYQGKDVKAFQDFCKEKMIEAGHSRFKSWLLTRGMGRLERWRQYFEPVLKICRDIL